MKKKIITRTTQISSRSTKYQSMLKTVSTTWTWPDFPSTEELQAHNDGWNVDILIENLKSRALDFLDFNQVPYEELDHWNIGIGPKEWLTTYDHIPGVRDAFRLLFEIHCFNLSREKEPEKAYAHLIRAALGIQAIIISEMEAQYFAGKGTQYGGKKAGLWSVAEHRKGQLLNVFCKYRDKGRDRATARRLAGEEIGLKQRQVDNYWSAAKIEAEYQKIKTLKT